MTPWDAAWHLLNALLAPFGVAAITVGLCGILGWPSGIRIRLAGHLVSSCGAAALAQLGAWAWWGAEGTMAGYAVMVVAVACTMWWRTSFGN